MGGDLVLPVGTATLDISMMLKVSLTIVIHCSSIVNGTLYRWQRHSNSEVKFFNSDRGCNWTGTIKKIDSHTATCE